MEIHLWRELLIPYELAVKELVIKFNHLKKEHKEKDLYSPIEQVSGRVKTINSCLLYTSAFGAFQSILCG